MAIIYMITSPSGRNYVGQTVQTLEKRMYQHRRPKSGCTILARSIRKYGWDRMSVQVLQECSNEELNDLERFYIEKFDCVSPNGMNCNSGGRSGHTFCKEIRLKLSNSCRRRKLGTIHEQPLGKFNSQISIMGTLYRVGCFDSREEAQIQIDSFFERYDPQKTDDRPPLPREHSKQGSGCIHYIKCTGKYRAQICRNGRVHYCGNYDTESDAKNALTRFNDEYDPENPPPIKHARPGTGSVSYHKHEGKYRARIMYNEKSYSCGYHATESEAREAIERFKDDYDPENPPQRERKMGCVWYDKRRGKYQARVMLNRKNHTLGSFPTESEARSALEKFKASLDVTTPAPIAPNVANN
jgi:group I intron endonuclease